MNVYSFAQDETTRLRIRFHNGYSTETWISANGNVSNRCGKHGCTLRFRNCGSAETHSLYSRIRNVHAVTETLISIVFPQLGNSTNTQLSAGFPMESLWVVDRDVSTAILHSCEIPLSEISFLTAVAMSTDLRLHVGLILINTHPRGCFI